MKKLFLCALTLLLLISSAIIITPAEETAAPAYIDNGFVAWYDGTDNQGTGTADLSATTWVNKVNNDEAWNITLTPDEDDKFIEGGFQVTNNAQPFPQNVVDIIRQEIKENK